MPDAFSLLREDLLRAGIAPARVDRYVSELADHRADIVDHLEQAGFSAQDAEAEATRRLGSHDALLLPMLADRRFRSLAHRAPALFYLVLPMAAQVGLALAGVLLLAISAETLLQPFLSDIAQLVSLSCLVAPVLTAWFAIGAAWRRRASLHWPIGAALALSSFAAALNIGVTMPSAAAAGQISLALALPAPLLLVALFALSLLPLVLRSPLRPAP